MRSFLLASLASLAITNIHAHPTRNSRLMSKRGVDISAFQLVDAGTSYVNATAIESNPAVAGLSKRADAQETANELVKATVPGATFRLANDHYVGTNGIAHFYFKQTANGLDIDNADFNVNIGRDGSVFSFGNSFFKGEIPSESKKRDKVDPANALKGAVNVLSLPVSADEATSEPKDEPDTFAIKKTSGAVKEPEARLVYLQKDGQLKLSWRVETDILDNWLLTYVDATTGEDVHGVVDYSADATYEVYPWGINDPSEGERQVIEDPFDPETSEFGWHSDGSEEYPTTRGNNAIAQNNPDNRPVGEYLSLYRPIANDFKFEYPFTLNQSDWLEYRNASLTQLFYTSNLFHDVLHKLGFDEQAGNFEANNNGAGGIGGDWVWLNSQDGEGTNNANFATPPDGQNGRMRMYIWTSSTPFRDSSFEAGVVIHEYTHGLSNRLTGGPANSGCLGIAEARGMGEGWSDFYATAIRLKPGDSRDTDYPMGAWVRNNPIGIRRYVYSTDTTTNPHVYKDADPLATAIPFSPHPIGTIWATMLYEVLWNLIDKHGKNDGIFPEFDANGVPTDGKFLAMKLVLDGMALQPCNPNFVSARDAILDADQNLTGGDNQCEIWRGFAKRGLGVDAVFGTRRVNSFDVPEEC